LNHPLETNVLAAENILDDGWETPNSFSTAALVPSWWRNTQKPMVIGAASHSPARGNLDFETNSLSDVIMMVIDR
jgi:hypothetical protein